MSVIVLDRDPVCFAYGQRWHIMKNGEEAKESIESEAEEVCGEKNEEMEGINEKTLSPK